MCEKCEKKSLDDLLSHNKQWAANHVEQDPEFFQRLSAQQAPDYLWIGCSDARVPANDIVGLEPGELFVHRNIANQVIHTDFNSLSVVQYAVEALKVKHIIVCGHYGCGGVNAAMGDQEHGFVDNWLRHIKDVYFRNQQELDQITDEKQKFDRLCELNVMAQVHNLARSKVVQRAWRNGQELHLHGWIYSLEDGVLQDLKFDIDGLDEVEEVYRMRP